MLVNEDENAGYKAKLRAGNEHGEERRPREETETTEVWTLANWRETRQENVGNHHGKVWDRSEEVLRWRYLTAI